MMECIYLSLSGDRTNADLYHRGRLGAEAPPGVSPTVLVARNSRGRTQIDRALTVPPPLRGQRRNGVSMRQHSNAAAPKPALCRFPAEETSLRQTTPRGRGGGTQHGTVRKGGVKERRRRRFPGAEGRLSGAINLPGRVALYPVSIKTTRQANPIAAKQTSLQRAPKPAWAFELQAWRLPRCAAYAQRRSLSSSA